MGNSYDTKIEDILAQKEIFGKGKSFSHRCEEMRRARRRIKGDILFRKREYPLWNHKRKASIASEQLEELQCLPIALPACGEAAFAPAIRLGVLLLSAAALLIL